MWPINNEILDKSTTASAQTVRRRLGPWDDTCVLWNFNVATDL